MQAILGVLLPAATFGGLLFYLGQRWKDLGWRLLALRTAVLSATYLVLSLEALSLFKAISWASLAVLWFLPGIGAWISLNRLRDQGHVFRLPSTNLKPDRWEWVMAGILGAILAITFLVAWLTPPQTWDSLSYHLSRVAHWAQNHSIGHYLTGIERQNSMSPAAELLVLNSYVLTGGDRLANFPQWLAMVGSLVGVSLVAGLLSANRFAQWLAVVFAATLPIGIAQASGTATDYVATFWTVCVAAETIQYAQNNDRRALAFASLAAGLAILTKPTVVPYILPIAAWIAILLIRRHGWMNAGKWGAVALVIVLGINAGYLSRNLLTYGGFANPSDLDYHSNQLRTLPGWISITMRNAGLQAGLPNSPIWNELVYKVILRVHLIFGLGLEDPRTTLAGYFQVRPPSTHEDFASNPYHAYLIVAVSALMIPLRKRIKRWTALYAACLVAGFLVFSFIYKWQIFGVRFQLLFFVLFAPFVGVVLSSLPVKIPGMFIAVSLFILAFPWLFSTESRPIFPQNEQGFSILSSPREELYGYYDPWAFEKIRQVSAYVQERDCSQVGLVLHGDDPEYLYWIALGAPRENLRIEWIVSGTPSTRYTPGDFQPCAILCKGCGVDPSSMRGLPLYTETSGYTVYMKNSLQSPP